MNEYYRIGQFSKLSQLPLRTLHYYDKIGLLKPIKHDKDSGYRYYSKDQLVIVNRISAYKRMEFTLEQIKFLNMGVNLKEQQQLLLNKKQEFKKTILQLEGKIATLDHWTANDIEQKQSAIVVKELPMSFVVYSRYRGKSDPQEFYLRYATLLNLIREHDLVLVGSMMSVYHDNWWEYDAQNADIEVCAKVSLKEPLEGIVRPWGGVLVASAIHYGSYATMNDTYQLMLSWIDKNGFTYLGPATEDYIIDVVSTNNPDDYITELILPIKIK